MSRQIIVSPLPTKGLLRLSSHFGVRVPEGILWGE
jgi:hypothetical protein